MPRKRHTPEQIIGKLREAEVGLSSGREVPEVYRTLGVTEQTYCRWRKEYGGLKVEQARRFRLVTMNPTRVYNSPRCHSTLTTTRTRYTP